MKVIVTGESERVVGIHVIGMGADEMMQGFGVAMKVPPFRFLFRRGPRFFFSVHSTSAVSRTSLAHIGEPTSWFE